MTDKTTDRVVVVDAQEASRQAAWDRLWDILLSQPPAIGGSEADAPPEVSKEGER